MSVCFAFASAQPIVAFGGDEATGAAESVYKVAKDARTLGELMKQLEPKLDSVTLAFAKAKMKGAEKEKFEIRKLSAKKLQITVEKVSVPIEFVGLEDGSNTRQLLLINGQEVEIDSLATPQENLDAVMKVMPSKTASLWNWILPEAEAQFDFSSMIVPMMAIGLTAFVISQAMQPPQPVYAYPSYMPGYQMAPGGYGYMPASAIAPSAGSYYPSPVYGGYSTTAPYYAPNSSYGSLVRVERVNGLGTAATFVSH